VVIQSKEVSVVPVISVLVPVYNDIERIEECIDSIVMQESSPHFELIVIDNGSTDGSYERLMTLKRSESVDVKVTQCLTPGSYAARNHGLELAQGEYIAFTDSDCIVSKQWLSNLYITMQSASAETIVAGKMVFFSDAKKTTEQSAIDFENFFSMKQDENAQNGKCITANFFCAMSLLEKHGGFNEKLKSGGDVEISERVVNGGGNVIYSDKAYVMHPSRNVQELLIKRQRIIGGTWDSKLSSQTFPSKIKFCWKLIRMFLGRSKIVVFSTSLSLRRKIKLIMLLFKIMAVSFIELIRLASGKQANRV